MFLRHSFCSKGFWVLDHIYFWEYKDTFIWGGVGCTFSEMGKRKITKNEKKRQNFIHMHIHCVMISAIFMLLYFLGSSHTTVLFLMSMFNLIDDPKGTFSIMIDVVDLLLWYPSINMFK